MNITFTNTAGGSKTASIETVVAAVSAGKVTKRGTNKYIRIGDSECDASTADVTNVDMTDTAGNTVHTTVASIITAIELKRTFARGSETYIRIGDAECLLSTAVVPHS